LFVKIEFLVKNQNLAKIRHLYSQNFGQKLEFFRRSGTLKAQVPGQPRIALDT